jgi:DNA-binding beta-propeller fold protein YncE
MTAAALTMMWTAWAVCVLPLAGAGPAPLAPVGSIELPHVEGRIDHMAYDPAGSRLFVAALGNNTVEVVDLKGGHHLRSLPGFREPQGLSVAPNPTQIAVANGQGEGVQLLADDYRVARSITLGDDSDNVRYDGAAGRFYVGYGSGALAAIDASSGRVTGTVKLAGHPESFQLERSGARIFVNVPSAGHIAVVDREQMEILGTWPVDAARANFPMALDESGQRLFIGCRRPARLLVYNTTSGKQEASADIVGDTDDLFYDSARKRVYVSGGEGFIDVLDADAPSLTRLTRIDTAPGARTSLFVPELGRLYLAVPHRGTQRAEIRVYEAR